VDETREWLASHDGVLPPVVARNAEAAGTDLAGYLSQGFGFTAFAHEDGVGYQTYATTGRGVEFLMGYYGVLDRAPRAATKATTGSSGSAATTSTGRHEKGGGAPPLRRLQYTST
jgi:hypothetical protein